MNADEMKQDLRESGRLPSTASSSNQPGRGEGGVGSDDAGNSETGEGLPRRFAFT